MSAATRRSSRSAERADHAGRRRVLRRRQPPRHAKPRHALTRYLIPFLRSRPRTVLRLLVFSVVEAAPALVSGQAVAHALDHGFLVGRPLVGFGALGVMALCALIGAWGTSRVYPLLAEIVEPFRDELVRRVVGATMARAVLRGEAGESAGIARLTHQVEIVRDCFAGILMVSRGFLFTTGSALLGMLSLDPVVLVLVLPPLALGVALFFGALARLAARQRELVLAEEDVARGMSTLVSGLRDIVASGAEQRVASEVGVHIEAQARAARRIARLTGVRDLAIGVGGWLPVLLVLVAAPWLARHGATAGSILGALTYLTQAMLPALVTLTRGFGSSGVRLSVTLGRILEVAEPRAVATPGPTPDQGSARVGRPLLAPRTGGGVDLAAVSFGYGRTAAPVVSELSLSVPAGDHLAVVGPSGIGKSTLAGLIAGTLRPACGEVRLGGVPIPDLTESQLAGYRTLIPQEAYVFTGTMRENLCYLAPNRGDAELDRAVRALGLGELLDRAGGESAMIEPGMFSAGERQLIALARAYLSPAALIVLDEATCHLDPAAEARVERAFAARSGTLVVIAHRVSSALRARRVLVLDGVRASVGTHQRMLVASPLYRDLVGHWSADGSPQQAESDQDPAAVTEPVQAQRPDAHAAL